jgi:anti-anti-sigma factor
MSDSSETSDLRTVDGSRDWFTVVQPRAGRFRLVGELDALAVGAVQDRLRRLGGDAEFECSEVTFIDLSGLRLLVAVREACEAGGGSLVVVNPSRCLVRLLALSGLSDVLVTRVDGSWPR